MRTRQIALALGLAALATSAGAVELKASLSGNNAGTGAATVNVDQAKPEVCYKLTLSGVANPTAAHIHRGAAGATGGVAVGFASPASGSSEGCAAVSKEVADDLVANPANYYVNVHTQAAPGGAIRGQLSK